MKGDRSLYRPQGESTWASGRSREVSRIHVDHGERLSLNLLELI